MLLGATLSLRKAKRSATSWSLTVSVRYSDKGVLTADIYFLCSEGKPEGDHEVHEEPSGKEYQCHTVEFLLGNSGFSILANCGWRISSKVLSSFDSKKNN